MNNFATNNSLLIQIFNINDLKNHINELQAVLYNKRIDIALITETHFIKYSHIHTPGFRLIKSNHPDNTVHGGVAILVKTFLCYQLILNYSYAHIQFYFIQIKLNATPSTIGAIDSRLCYNITKAIFSNYFSKIKNNFSIGRNSYAKHQSWDCRINNPHGTVLYNLANEKFYKIVPPPQNLINGLYRSKRILKFQTYFTVKIFRNLYCSTNNILDRNSDHSSVLLSIQLHLQHEWKHPKLLSFLTNRQQLYDLISKKINLNINLKSILDIDDAVNNLMKHIKLLQWIASESDKNKK